MSALEKCVNYTTLSSGVASFTFVLPVFTFVTDHCTWKSLVNSLYSPPQAHLLTHPSPPPVVQLGPSVRGLLRLAFALGVMPLRSICAVAGLGRPRYVP